MTLDATFSDQNRASTDRIRELAARLSDEQMGRPVGEHWTVGIVFTHLAFWDRRVLYAIERSEQEGALFIPNIDIAVNDLSLPIWAAVPPREAARLAVDAAEELDRRLEQFAPELREGLYAYNPRWVLRARHRNEHLDEAEAAAQGS